MRREYNVEMEIAGPAAMFARVNTGAAQLLVTFFYLKATLQGEPGMSSKKVIHQLNPTLSHVRPPVRRRVEVAA